LWCPTTPTPGGERASSSTTRQASKTTGKSATAYPSSVWSASSPTWHAPLSPPDALAVLDEAFARFDEIDRPMFRRRLRERVQDRPDPRGTRIGRRLIDLATGRAASPAESWLLWLVVDLGFPVPEANVPVHDVDGRPLYWVDVGWRSLRIAIEYNGYAAHAGRKKVDEARIRDLEAAGGS
jgi:hypothetical protein